MNDNSGNLVSCFCYSSDTLTVYAINFSVDCYQECSPEPIYKISAPQGFMGWLGFLCSGMELAGKPASKQFLAYWFKLRAQPSLKMLVSGMNLAGKF